MKSGCGFLSPVPGVSGNLVRPGRRSPTRTVLGVARSRVYTRSRDRVLQLCDSIDDARSLRLQLVDEIRGVVGFDAYAWLLTDPETSVGSSPLADVPCLPALASLIRLKYLTDVNRWTQLEPGAVALLREVTAGDLSRSLLYRELLHRYDVGDIASAVYRDRFGCWGFLDLWRSSTRAPFNRSEADFLAELAVPITSALRRSQANSFVTSDHSRPRGGVGPVVLLLSGDLEVLKQTPQTEGYLRLLIPTADDRTPIPASAYNVAAQLLAVEADVDRNAPSARVHLSDGMWVTLRAARIGAPDADDDRDIAVTIEQTSPLERMAFFAKAFGLSARENELLVHLAAGSDTRELGAKLFLSEHTVQDHLKSIFAKTGSHSRRTLVSRALGA
jgi:DNA-binding CsgD family transcriptional regulator